MRTSCGTLLFCLPTATATTIGVRLPCGGTKISSFCKHTLRKTYATIALASFWPWKMHYFFAGANNDFHLTPREFLWPQLPSSARLLSLTTILCVTVFTLTFQKPRDSDANCSYIFLLFCRSLDTLVPVRSRLCVVFRLSRVVVGARIGIRTIPPPVAILFGWRMISTKKHPASENSFSFAVFL